MRIPPFALAALLLAGCPHPPPTPPAESYSRFLRHIAMIRGGDEAALMDDFDAATRAALTAQAAASAKAADHQLPADPVIQLLQGPPPVTPTAITVVEQTADRATLDIQVDAGASGRVVMVLEGGRWRVHLDFDAPK